MEHNILSASEAFSDLHSTTTTYDKMLNNMRDSITWLISHLLNIFAHICLFFAGFIAFAIIGMSGPTSISYVGLPWAACGIAIVGAGVNLHLFYYMRRLQRPRDESNQDRLLKIKFAFAASMAGNVPLVAVDFTIAVVTATKVRSGGAILAAPVTLATIAGFIALWTVIADIVNLRGLDAQTHPTNIFTMEPSETDEDV